MELIGRGRGRKGQVNILKWSFISSFKNPVPKKHESHSFKHEMKGQKTCGCDYMVDPLFLLMAMKAHQVFLSISACIQAKSICICHKIISF